MRDFEYQDENAPSPGAFSDDILPIDLERDLERVRRWIHNFQAIRVTRPFTPLETAEYNEVCAEEDRLREIRSRRRAGTADREPLREGYGDLGEFVLAHTAWQLRTRGWDTLNHEPRPESFSDLETFAGVHQAWEDRQTERVRQQVARNQEVFGGVRQARTAPADGVDNVLRDSSALTNPGLQYYGFKSLSVILGGPKACRHCGEEQTHHIRGQAGPVPRACRCDRPRTGHLEPATLSMDMLEIEWAAEGITFAGELKSENERRKGK